MSSPAPQSPLSAGSGTHPALDGPVSTQGALTVHVTRSARRQRTMSARLVGTRLEVRLPADLPAADERRFIEKMVARFSARRERRALSGPGDLMRRAQELNERYFGGALRPASVEYVGNQQRLYGSCTPRTRRIRLSDRLATMPTWVRDYVLVHELAHLREPNHSHRFWALVTRYELAERARGYLMGAGLEPATEGEEADGDLQDIESEIDVMQSA